MRTIFAYLLCCLVANCATTRGAGEVRADAVIKQAEAIESNAETGKFIVHTSSATPDEKAKLTEIFNRMAQTSREIKEPVKELGHDVDVNKMVADKLQATVDSLRKYQYIVYAVLIGAAILGFVWFKFIRK